MTASFKMLDVIHTPIWTFNVEVLSRSIASVWLRSGPFLFSMPPGMIAVIADSSKSNRDSEIQSFRNRIF